MEDIILFNHTLKELFPSLIKIGFILGLIGGAYLLLNY